MWLGQDESIQGLGCPGGCGGATGQYQWGNVGGWGLGEIAEGPDGNLYQWVAGVDGLGNPVGFWKRWRRRVRGLVRRALPLAQRLAPFVPIPGAAAALTAATPFLKAAGFAGYDGFGALYQAPDGSVYRMQGIDADDDLNGFADEDELRGLSQAELQGLAADDELNDDGDIQGFADDDVQGLEDDADIQGFEADGDVLAVEDDNPIQGFEDDEMSGFENDDMQGFEDDEMQGVEGYVRPNGVNGYEAFVPDAPRQTPWFKAPAQAPPLWSPIW